MLLCISQNITCFILLCCTREYHLTFLNWYCHYNNRTFPFFMSWHFLLLVSSTIQKELGIRNVQKENTLPNLKRTRQAWGKKGGTSGPRGGRDCSGNSVSRYTVAWLLEKGNSPHILIFCSLPRLARLSSETTVSYKAFFLQKIHNCRHFITNSLFLRNKFFSFCSKTRFYFLFPLGPVFIVSVQQFQCQCQHKDRNISSLWQVWQSCFQCF